VISPKFSLTVDDRRVMLHFDKLIPVLQTNLRTTVTKLTDQLLALVRAAEPVRTGLLRSRTASFVDVKDEYVRGRVRVLATGSAQRLAAGFGALEYGAHREISVRQSIVARAYLRRVNIAERRFLRGPAAAMRERITAELQAAVAKSVQQVNNSP
jgi:hypothetical protein